MNKMVRARRLTAENNNRKVTDFFSQQPSSSCRVPPSSAPVLSTTTKHLVKQPPEPRKTTLAQTQPSTQVHSKSHTISHSSPLRSVKKENAPPSTFPPPLQVHTSLPPDREVAYVSSSSDAPSHISISSASVISLGSSSVVEVVPAVKQDRRHLQTFNVASSSPLPSQRRCSPRLQVPTRRPSRMDLQNPASPRKPTRKRKKPEGVQSDDGDVVDLEAMEEVIVVSRKPARIDLTTPEPSVQSRPSLSRKRACLNPTPSPGMSSDPVEVVPSSQSDEREMNLPKKSHKDLREITEQVREWQFNSSQSNVPPESSDPFNGNDDDDVGLDMEFDYPQSSPVERDKSATPVSSSRTTRASSQVTPRKDSTTQTPTRTSTPQNLALSVGDDRVEYLTSRKSSSPIFVSSASSLTKVATPVKLSSSRKNDTPGSSSSKTSYKNRSIPPGKFSPTKAGTPMDLDIPLLNQNEKTEAIVERIKAEARAKALAMPDDDSMVLGSLDDSDSELGSPTNIFSELANARTSHKAADKRTTSKKTDESGDSSPLTDVDELEDQANRRRSTRRSSRRSPSPSSSSSAATRSRRPPNRIPTTITNATNAPPRKQVNPFARLLKEKARRDRFAEVNSGPELEDEVNLSDAAEGSANGASGSGSQLRRENSDEGDIETMVRKADSRKLFGEEDNGVVGKILENDSKDRGKGKTSAAKLGISVWETLSRGKKQADSLRTSLPALRSILQDPSFSVLRKFVTSDADAAPVILQSGLLAFENAAFMEWLVEVSICTSGDLAISAHNALEQICEVQSGGSKTMAISITPVLRALSKLGMRQEILSSLHLEGSSGGQPALPDVQRSEALWRLSEIVRALASRELLDVEDVPTHFGLLVAVGMDISTDFDLRLSIKRALSTLITKYCGEFTDTRGEMEMEICSKVLALCSDLTPANKVHLLSFIEGDSPLSRRVGQWIAFAMLTGDYGARLAREFVAGAPSLADVIALLEKGSDAVSRSDLFNISRNSENFESFDYTALGHHVEVLGRVLMNIPQYLLVEKAETCAAQDSGISPRHPSKEPSKVEKIKSLLERLGNNIADTRAAHLDRSHTKAVIQQLAMRIDYQRKAAYERPKIKNFFGSKST